MLIDGIWVGGEKKRYKKSNRGTMVVMGTKEERSGGDGRGEVIESPRKRRIKMEATT